MALKNYLNALRPQFLPASIVPASLGASVALHETGSVSFGMLALTLIAVSFCHLGLNALNDYFDYKNDADNLNPGDLRPFAGGSGEIQKGGVIPKKLALLATFLVAAGSILGLIISFLSGPWLLVIGLTGVVTGLLYSSPLVFFAGRGLGELIVGLNFGLLTVSGSYYAQTGRLGIAPVAASIPMALLVAAILLINEFPDYESDKKAGKRNLVVRLGFKRARVVLALLFALSFASIAVSTALRVFPPIALIALLAAPLGVYASLIRPDAKPTTRLLGRMKATIASHFATGALLTIAFVLQAPAH